MIRGRGEELLILLSDALTEVPADSPKTRGAAVVQPTGYLGETGS